MDSLLDLSQLFIGWHPHEIFFEKLSVDFSELIIVLSAIIASLGVLVVFSNWWSR